MQDEPRDVVFGTAVVGGFNRKHVLDYIEKLQNLLTHSGADAEEARALLQKAEEELRALQEEMQKKSEALEALQTENRALQMQLEAARLEARQARQETAQLRSSHPLRRGKK